jgi:hypothetical protein
MVKITAKKQKSPFLRGFKIIKVLFHKIYIYKEFDEKAKSPKEWGFKFILEFL